MKTEFFTLNGSGGEALHGVIWIPHGEARLVLQVTHGMTEHMGRYEDLARALAADGVITVGFDLRGHGRNPGDPMCASFGEGGWEASLEDMHRLRGLLEQHYPNLPQVMLGFSLGSFLLRDYLNSYLDKVDGAVIMGTGSQPAPILAVLKTLIRAQAGRAGFDCTTPLVQKLSFGLYNKKFTPNQTPSDWLCSDARQLDAYLADPLCRADISAGLFYQLLDSMQRTGSASAYDRWDRDMPVLLLSGQEDPVGDFGKGVQRVEAAMRKAGLTRVQSRLFARARHDLLHEQDNGSADRALEELRSFLHTLL